MKIELNHKGIRYEADFDAPLDISIPLHPNGTVNCFYAPSMKVNPVVSGDFIGSTAQGGPLNFMNVSFNPHGNGTHTECVGHIASEKFTINETLRKFNYIAKLVSVSPVIDVTGDKVIYKNQLESLVAEKEVEALIIRTLPNADSKLEQSYSGENPPYTHYEAIEYLVKCGVKHLLIDLPSVDREEDDGLLLAHKAFWQYPKKVRENCTISELIYVNSDIKDGLYLLNMQIASFEIDVSPSKPILYQLRKI